jgi:hypothetical protein
MDSSFEVIRSVERVAQQSVADSRREGWPPFTTHSHLQNRFNHKAVRA